MSIDKIETDHLPDLEAALIKGNTNRALAALVESLKILVKTTKETNEAIAKLSEAAPAKPITDARVKDEMPKAVKTDASKEKPPQPAKKTPVKKTGGEPTSDVLIPPSK